MLFWDREKKIRKEKERNVYRTKLQSTQYIMDKEYQVLFLFFFVVIFSMKFQHLYIYIWMYFANILSRFREFWFWTRNAILILKFRNNSAYIYSTWHYDVVVFNLWVVTSLGSNDPSTGLSYQISFISYIYIMNQNSNIITVTKQK